MSRRGKFILTAAFAACLIALAAVSVCFGGFKEAAFAVDTDVNISMQPQNVNAVYGDGEFELGVGLSSPAVAQYAWYKSDTPGGVAVRVAEGSGASPSLKVSKATDSGYYYCLISALTYGGNRYETELVSDRAAVSIEPKPISVKVGEDKIVYNGQWQSPKFEIDSEELIEGDTVNARLDTERATINAGTYVGTIVLDNPQYAVDGEKEITFTIEKAPLTVRVKEVGVRAGKEYTLEIEYVGFKGADDESALGFIPQIPQRFLNVTTAGVYDVVCTGASESANYVIEYEAAKLYVNDATLGQEAISGITATAGGSFRRGTALEVAESERKINGFGFLKRVQCVYEPKFTSGGADGETYTLNIEENFSKFMLAVCTVDDKGNTKSANGFSYRDGVLSVTLPADFEGGIVVYNDYTIITIVGAVLLLVILIMIIAIFSSKRKYKNHLFYYRAAQKEADRYR